MADLTQTAANVQLMSSAAGGVRVIEVQAATGVTVTQGMPVYRLTGGTYGLAEAAHTELTLRATVAGIALTPAAADEFFLIATFGKLDIGATLTVNQEYVLSDTAGKIMPKADLTTGEKYSSLGAATATDTLDLRINNSDVTQP